MLSFRVATLKDHKLIQEFTNGLWPKNNFRNGEQVFFLLYEDSQLVSCAGFCVTGEIANLLYLITHKDQREKGYGSCLLLACITDGLKNIRELRLKLSDSEYEDFFTSRNFVKNPISNQYTLSITPQTILELQTTNLTNALPEEARCTMIHQIPLFPVRVNGRAEVYEKWCLLYSYLQNPNVAPFFSGDLVTTDGQQTPVSAAAILALPFDTQHLVQRKEAFRLVFEATAKDHHYAEHAQSTLFKARCDPSGRFDLHTTVNLYEAQDTKNRMRELSRTQLIAVCIIIITRTVLIYDIFYNAYYQHLHEKRMISSSYVIDSVLEHLLIPSQINATAIYHPAVYPVPFVMSIDKTHNSYMLWLGGFLPVLLNMGLHFFAGNQFFSDLISTMLFSVLQLSISSISFMVSAAVSQSLWSAKWPLIQNRFAENIQDFLNCHNLNMTLHLPPQANLGKFDVRPADILSTHDYLMMVTVVMLTTASIIAIQSNLQIILMNALNNLHLKKLPQQTTEQLLIGDEPTLQEQIELPSYAP